ncbi:S-adenosyl-l-methionine hydroxide adenosyltransferase family protein [Danxiaibacter flavus]|uniref:S-adenosyl-l-methionine hydroxide adenosyltransferase family protein n=1 Tax=Danxiaibacter flavus TaxID=3049108 RepID=A0ABV3Z9A6_9BACT|nr:S-adenosyl-l-methionine hydroxide adenosyltransferase family protein [Chitinophagaceae bacterium DXS]
MRKSLLLLLFCAGIQLCLFSQNSILVFQSDFGLKDGAVSAMKGVAMGVSPQLKIFDLTHEIPAFNIWEAAYRLQQTAQYWPVGTVFVSVVDPGVGSERKSVVLKTKSGHFFVTPDNGTLTLIAQHLGIDSVREIDEVKNRLKNSNASYTFHGRDVYAYTGARLASGTIRFDEVGGVLPAQVVTIDFQQPVFENGVVKGNIPILDIQYGNVWTNIDKETFNKLEPKYGDKLNVQIFHNQKLVYKGVLPYETTFSGVPNGKPLCYLNSLLNVSFALNQGNFSRVNKIFSGPDWSVTISK